MDSLTQVLGAAIGGTVLGRRLAARRSSPAPHSARYPISMSSSIMAMPWRTIPIIAASAIPCWCWRPWRYR